MTLPLARLCRELVYRVAEKHEVPPVAITAHIRDKDADRARYVVWRFMVWNLGMSRQLVADIFGRDRRRIRASALRFSGRKKTRKRKGGAFRRR